MHVMYIIWQRGFHDIHNCLCGILSLEITQEEREVWDNFGQGVRQGGESGSRDDNWSGRQQVLAIVRGVNVECQGKWRKELR